MSVEYKRIKNRRNTAAGWTQSNPILLEGELGIELDTSKFKFGDGTTHWNDLPYASADEEEIQEIVESISYTKAEVNTIVNTIEGTIPTSTSQLTNDAGFITNADIPTNISAFNNDAGYITASEIPAQINSDWNAASGVAQILNKPNLATVATSGSYNDLSDKPTIPGQVQADWTENDTSSSAYIQHKPTIPSKTSDLTNDSGFITEADVKNYKNFPQGWHTTGTLSNLISDINNDSTAVTGMSYMATVSFSDLPANLQQAEIKVDIMDEMQGLGKNILFTVTSSDTSPYHWEYTSAYGAAGTWREWMPNVTLATVAISGDYTDLSNTPSIPTKTSDLTNDSGYITLNEVPGQMQADWTEVNSTLGSFIQHKPSLATVAISGNYNDLTDKPTIPAAQVNSDWNAASGVAQILNKPTIPTDTSDLTNGAGYITNADIPTNISAFNNDAGYITASEIPAQAQADWTEADTSDPSFIQNKPTIPTLTSQLTNDSGYITASEIPAQVQSDWTEVNSTLGSYIQHKPTIYNEWFGTQQEYDAIVIKDADTIYHIEGGATVTWNEVIGKPTFATVAMTGSYNDLSNTPTIPTDTSDLTNGAGFITINDVPAQAQADWTEADTSDPSFIQNKPTIPTVNDATVTFTQGGVTKGSVTLNQGTDTTIALDAGSTQVNADWTESDPTDPSFIQNKPTIPAAQVNSDWNAASGVAQILNKPTIPTVPGMTIEALTFTLQDSSTKTIEFYTVPDYFYVEDKTGDAQITIKKSNADAPTIEVFYSIDRINWTSAGTTSTTAITVTVPGNTKLYLKCNTDSWTNTNGAKYNQIGLSYPTHEWYIGGNIMSLIYGDNFTGKISFPTASTYNFANLIGPYSGLKDLSNLKLPATTLTQGCYESMFYRSQKLTTAPELPATTLASNCYKSMFNQCTSLTTAPILPATTLTQYCYQYMFQGCTALNSVTTYANTISATQCLQNWLNNVSATGDFYNLGSATYQSGASGIPSGWTIHTSL